MPSRIRNNAHVAGRGLQSDTISRSPNIPTPDFPLAKPTDSGLTYWRELWETHPLNRWWIDRGLIRELALYVRLAIRVEEGAVTAPLLAQLRAARSDLGLSAVGAKNLGLVYTMGDESDDWKSFLDNL